MLFQGEEWAASTPFQYFTDHGDPDLGRRVSDGRRQEFAHFGWDPEQIPDPQAASTFAASRLRWSELAGPSHAGVLDWYRRLVGLRRGRPELSDPRLDRTVVEIDERDSTLVMERGRVRLLVNLGDDDRRFPRSEGVVLVLASDSDVRLDHDGVVLPPDSVAVLDVDPDPGISRPAS
jgi:maltooligosyltrehalose trehalohydrolase